MKSDPRVTFDIPLMSIGYKCRYQKVLEFIATDGGGSTETGVSYLSCYPENISNVSICSVFFPCLFDRYSSDFN